MERTGTGIVFDETLERAAIVQALQEYTGSYRRECRRAEEATARGEVVPVPKASDEVLVGVTALNRLDTVRPFAVNVEEAAVVATALTAWVERRDTLRAEHHQRREAGTVQHVTDLGVEQWYDEYLKCSQRLADTIRGTLPSNGHAQEA